jgi:hypothetical protein
MRSLTSLHESRTCSPQNFWSPVQNDFCNKIGQQQAFSTSPKFLLPSATSESEWASKIDQGNRANLAAGVSPR